MEIEEVIGNITAIRIVWIEQGKTLIKLFGNSLKESIYICCENRTTKMTKYIGIDVGLTGGFGVIDDNRVYTAPIPTLWVVKKTTKGDARRRQYNEIAIRTFLKTRQEAIVALEEQFPMPFEFKTKDGKKQKRGATSGFTTGDGYGLFRGILCGLGMTRYIVHPKDWQKEFFKRDTTKTTKEQALEAIQELYPNVDLYRTERTTKPDHNLVDALLIAEWGKRKHEGVLKK